MIKTATAEVKPDETGPDTKSMIIPAEKIIKF